MLRACQGFSVRVAHLEKQQTRHGNLFLPSLPRRYTNKVVRWVSKPTGLFRGGQCPRQASQLVALPRDLPNRASGSISPLFGRPPPPEIKRCTGCPGNQHIQAGQQEAACHAASAPESDAWAARQTTGRGPNLDPPPPNPSPATPRRRHSTVLAMGTLPPPSRTRPMVRIAEPTFFADSFRYSLPPYTTTPQQVPGPLRRESASHHMVLRTTSAR